MTTTETKTGYPTDEAVRVIDRLEEEVIRAECMAKATGNEQMICALWKEKAETFRTAIRLIRRAYP